MDAKAGSAYAKRIAAGIACLLAGALVTGWAVGRFVPGTPRPAAADVGVEEPIEPIISTRYGSLTAESIVDIPHGSAYCLEGLTQGKLFWTGTKEHLADMDDAEREAYIEKNHYIQDLEPVTVTVGDTKIVSRAAFEEWYPHYAEVASFASRDRDSFIVLVEVQVSNPSAATATLPPFALWSDALSEIDSGFLDAGWDSGDILLGEFYGVPADNDRVFYALPDGWNELEPGETQTRTLPFIVPKDALVRTERDGGYDLSSFCVTAWDCDPPTVYRFRLA